MSIRDQAVAAFEAEAQERVAATHQHLMDTLFIDSTEKILVDPKTITSVYVDHSDNMYIFTDGSIHLAVIAEDPEWEIYVVSDEDGWTRKSEEPITSLAELGEYIKSTETETL